MQTRGIPDSPRGTRNTSRGRGGEATKKKTKKKGGGGGMCSLQLAKLKKIEIEMQAMINTVETHETSKVPLMIEINT